MIHLTTGNAGNRDRTRQKQSKQLNPSNYTVDPTAAYERRPSWKSTAYASTKLAINMVKESSDAFPPLKSVAGGLSAILQHCDVRSTSYTTLPMMLMAALANDCVSPNN